MFHSESVCKSGLVVRSVKENNASAKKVLLGWFFLLVKSNDPVIIPCAIPNNKRTSNIVNFTAKVSKLACKMEMSFK